MQFTAFAKEKKNTNYIDFLNMEHAKKVLQFHQSFPIYRQTPLLDLHNLAGKLGIKNFFVKDESYRFGLNAFKVLGGSFAIGSYIAERLGMDIAELPYERMISRGIRNELGDITFATATDGNHGRGVAWTAKQLKQKAVVYMPKGSSQERFESIKAENAEVTITNLNYDDTVRMAHDEADKNGWVMVQDTSWEGYQDIPKWIIQGYGTMALEAYTQLPENPTHIFIQAGVGALAGAVTGFFANACKGSDKPIVTIVEPDAANCIFRTAKAADGKLHFVSGDMNTMMAGLACGEPCDIGWRVLESYADFSISCPDYISAKGMRILGAPVPGDTRIISGESGATSSGAVIEILSNPRYEDFQRQIGLTKDSVILCFSTEGATDEENYRAITWDGKESSDKK
jgi:diaminopropionate ammonia-lyase